VETDVLDYALATILSIVNNNNEVYLVAFHSCTFTIAELNYNIYNKELLSIFKVFKNWQYYLEGLAYPINVVMDHKNLEYFSTTKVLTWRQVQWSEYLFQLNLIIRFRPGCLGTKTDALTRQWDVYSKGEILATPQSTLTTSSLSLLKNNLQPLYKLLSFFSLLSVQLQS